MPSSSSRSSPGTGCWDIAFSSAAGRCWAPEPTDGPSLRSPPACTKDLAAPLPMLPKNQSSSASGGNSCWSSPAQRCTKTSARSRAPPGKGSLLGQPGESPPGCPAEHHSGLGNCRSGSDAAKHFLAENPAPITRDLGQTWASALSHAPPHQPSSGAEKDGCKQRLSPRGAGGSPACPLSFWPAGQEGTPGSQPGGSASSYFREGLA